MQPKLFFGKSLLTKCLSILIIAFLISFLTATVFAEELFGTQWHFTLGDNNYRNLSMLAPSKQYFSNTTFIDCESGQRPAGYLGAIAHIYKQNPDGSTYTLLESSPWVYSTTSTSYIYGQEGYTIRDDSYYMGSGETAVYYNGSYQRNWTYGTPLYRYFW